ncbi:MAG TPA: sugar transferase [bacterium]
MLTIFENERARADRTGHGFSLTLFNFEARNNEAHLTKLAEILSNRVRCIDAVGRLHGWRVGVVLPDTPAVGAWKLIADVRRAAANVVPNPICTVYAYPSNELTEEKDKGEIQARLLTREQGETVVSGMAEPHVNPENLSSQKSEAAPIVTRPRQPFWKRGLDILGASVGLIALSSLLLVISVLIKLTSPGPIIFKQQRLGYAGRSFMCWKFRTMRSDADKTPHREYLEKLITSDMPMTKLDSQNDARIFPFGRLLRQLYLDELPQLINVLKGDMSLVGPRPCLPYEAQKYLHWQNSRFDVLPGMTGLWQVSGKNDVTFKDMIRLDISYARNRSFWLDLEILVKTVPCILKQILGHGSADGEF